jgi:hypothetical protein
MLTVQTQPAIKVLHHSHGDHLTKLELQHRKSGELATLHIFSRIPLSFQECRDSVAKAFNCDRWAFRQLSASAEFAHF